MLQYEARLSALDFSHLAPVFLMPRLAIFPSYRKPLSESANFTPSSFSLRLPIPLSAAW